MKKLIYIDDTDQNDFLIPLSDVLGNFDKVGSQYIWTILSLDATGDLGGVATYDEIYEAISSSPKGYSLDWSRLMELSGKFNQVINMILVASENEPNVQVKKYDDDFLHKNFAIVIEIIDGGRWEICTSDSDLISKIMSRYKNIKIKNIEKS